MTDTEVSANVNKKESESLSSKAGNVLSDNKPKSSQKNTKASYSEQRLLTKLLSVRRVTKMNKGGRKLRLSVLVVVGDGNGRVGLGVGKGVDLKIAQDKAVVSAKKRMFDVRLSGSTLPHDLFYKYKAAKIMLKPAKEGTGVVAGSSIRLIAEAAGIKDMYAKILGTNNAVTNAYAFLNALKLIR